MAALLNSLSFAFTNLFLPLSTVSNIMIIYGQFHVTTDTTPKNKSSYAEYLVKVIYCTHITCHGFKGNIQIQLNDYEISPFEQLCEKLPVLAMDENHP